MFKDIPIPLINTFISAGAIIIGTLLGSYCSWIITKKSTKLNLIQQKKLLYENINYDKEYQKKRICEYANIIRLDICTAIYESLRILKLAEEGKESKPVILPVNEKYSSVIATLSSKYQLEELSYIYQLYALIETINHTIIFERSSVDYSKRVQEAYRDFLYKLYNENIDNIFKVKIEDISYKAIYDNLNTDRKYRKILLKLDKLCKNKKE
ncbi:MAG: hypothetical protein ACI33K_13945 [Clostridiaceae bacterium]